MAGQTFFFLWHGCYLAVDVAIQTRKTFHAHTMYPFVYVAFEAVCFVWCKIMFSPGMALLAFYFFHEDMTSMAIGFSQSNATLPCGIEVARITAVPWGHATVFLLNGTSVAGYNIFKKKLVLSDQVH